MSTKKQKRERLQKAREETAKREFKYTTAQTLIGIFALALMFFAWGSHLLPVTDPVESNYALTAKEMVLSGNWLSPQIYGHFWFDKPAMVYWLMSISYSFFGFTDFASRLPAAFCGAATITLLVWYIRRITKNNVVAVWSGIMLATSLEFWIISHAIITDSMLMLFTVPTLLSAYIGLMENNRRHMVIAYFSSGLACLSKGPVGLVLPGMLLLIWCGLMRNKNYSSVSFPGRESLSSSSLPSLGTPACTPYMAIHSSANFSVFTILSVPHHPNIREIITSTTIFFFSLSLFSPGQDFFSMK